MGTALYLAEQCRASLDTPTVTATATALDSLHATPRNNSEILEGSWSSGAEGLEHSADHVMAVLGPR
jgi:hypothetical protein